MTIQTKGGENCVLIRMQVKFMSTQIIITLAVTVIMSILFLSGKFPFGLITMACSVALVVAGVNTVSESFSGLSSQNIVMVASMFAMSAALQKTSLAFKLKRLLSAMAGKRDMALVVVMVGVYVVMLVIMPGIVAMAMILAFMDALPDTGEVAPSRVIMPLLMLNVCWEGLIPVGLGVTRDFNANAYMGGIVTNPEHLFQYGDNFRMRIIPSLAMLVIVLFIWKVFPKKPLNLSNVSEAKIESSALLKWQEILIYVLFAATIVVLVFNSYLGGLMWIFPAACVCVLGFTKIMTKTELVNSLASDTVWMLAGILGVTGALTKTGAAEVLGNLLLKLISWTDNGFLILLIICAFTSLMTTFLSNGGTVAVLIPLVASMAVAGNMDPRGMVGVVSIAANYAFCFPTGSTTCALAFAAGQYNPFQIMKYTLPCLVVVTILTAASAYFIFPPFG